MQTHKRNSRKKLRATVIFPAIYVCMIVITFATGGNGDTLIGDLTFLMSIPLGILGAALASGVSGESGMFVAAWLALLFGVIQYSLRAYPNNTPAHCSVMIAKAMCSMAS